MTNLNKNDIGKVKKTQKRKRVWSITAKDKTFIRVYLWLVKPPVRNPKDIIEIHLKSKYIDQSWFVEPWEADHIASGCYLALIEYIDKFRLEKL